MIIVSQDKDTIVNFNNIEILGIGNPLEDDEGKFKILVNMISCEQYIIAKYITEERAKEVLQEIISTYKFDRCEAVGQKRIKYMKCQKTRKDKTMKDKWKEKTKLNKIKIKEIIVEVLLAIICIVIAIINKDYTYFLVAGLDVIIAIQTYFYYKLLKSKEAIIELKDEEIEHKNGLIKTLLMRESRK